MRYNFRFNLVRPAQYAGGDRYEFSEKGKTDFMSIYLPQDISRPMGLPLPAVMISVSSVASKDTTEE